MSKVPQRKMLQPPQKLLVKVSFGLEEVPKEFNLRQRLLSQYGRHLEEIRVRTKAEITLGGLGSGELEAHTGFEAPESLFIQIAHPNLLALQNARQMAEGVVESVRQDFEHFQEQLRGKAHQVSTIPTITTTIKGISKSQRSVPPPRQLTVVKNVSDEAPKSAVPESSTLKRRGSLDEDRCKIIKPNVELETNLSGFKEECKLKTTQVNPVVLPFQNPFRPSLPPQDCVSASTGTSATTSGHFSPYQPKTTTTTQQKSILGQKQSATSSRTDASSYSLPKPKTLGPQSFAQVMKQLGQVQDDLLCLDTFFSKGPPQKTSCSEDSQNDSVGLKNTVQYSVDSTPHFSVGSNLGPIKVSLSPRSKMSLYAAIANQLFGPFRSLRELELSASALYRRAVNYTRKNKTIFFHRVKSFYNEVDKNHRLDDEIAFQCGCVVLSDTNHASLKGQILLPAIADLFSTPICIFDEVSLSVDCMVLAPNQTVVFPVRTVTKLPLNIVKRQSDEDHYDSVTFQNTQKPLTGQNSAIETSQDNTFPCKT